LLGPGNAALDVGIVRGNAPAAGQLGLLNSAGNFSYLLGDTTHSAGYLFTLGGTGLGIAGAAAAFLSDAAAGDVVLRANSGQILRLGISGAPTLLALRSSGSVAVFKQNANHTIVGIDNDGTGGHQSNLTFYENAINLWAMFKAQGDSRFHIWDWSNGRDMVLLTPGSTSAAATTEFASKVQADGGIVTRVNTLVVSTSTYTPNTDTTDLAIISSPTAAFTVANPSGTAADGQRFMLRIASGATGWTPTWGTNYLSSGIATLPTTALPASKTVTFGFIYDAAKTKWVLLAADGVGY
jgi:hypothetical protein